MEKFSVDILSYNDEKNDFDKTSYYCKNMVEVSRVLITHKFKKNYYLVNANICKVETLV